MTEEPPFLDALGQQLAAAERHSEERLRLRQQRSAVAIGLATLVLVIVGSVVLLRRAPGEVTSASEADVEVEADVGKQPADGGQTADGDQAADAETAGVPPGDLLDPWDAADTVIGGEHRPGLFWTGDELLVIRTENGGNDVAGERWDPETNTATAMAASGLTWRAQSAMVWTGEELLIVGGSSGPELEPIGAAYDPETDRWRPIADPPGEVDGWENSIGGTAVWTGTEMVLWRSALAYNPAGDRWRMTAESPLSPRAHQTTVWTGEELVVWGGCFIADGQCDERNSGLLADGAVYDPVLDRWTPLPPSPLAPAAHTVGAWTGEEVVIVITETGPETGERAAAYDPSSGTWRPLPPIDLSPRRGAAGVMDGSELIVFGGATPDDGRRLNDGVRYYPSSGRSTALAGSPGPGRAYHSMTSVGDQIYISATRDASPPLLFAKVTCPVTRPPIEPFIPPDGWPAVPADDGSAWYGGDELWTVVDVDGHRGRKNVWWSAAFPGGAAEESPELEVRFDRLDEAEDPIIFGAPGTNAFTEQDGWFMINGIEPDRPGCWQATARYKGASLSYVYEIGVEGASG